jgi:cell division septal protein FtsQ
VIVLAAALAGGAAFGLNRFAADPRFGLDWVDVAGARMTPAGEVRNSADLQYGANVWLMNVAAAQARVGQLPWVKTASITRSWPNHVSVSITERSAVAVLALTRAKGPGPAGPRASSGQVALVDDGMHVLQVGSFGSTGAGLPVLQIDPPVNGVSPGADLSAGDVQRAYDVLEQVRALGLRVSQVSVTPDFGESVVTDGGLCVILGSDENLAAKVSLLRTIEPRIVSVRDVVYVDLRSVRAPTVLYR